MSNKVNNQATTGGMDSEDISISPHKKQCRVSAPPVVSPLHCSCSEPTSIAFSSDYPRSMKMIEVNDELLQVLLNQRRHAATTLPSSTAAAAVVAPLCIKGDPLLRSEAVLCSRDKTYGLKRVETSNSLFSVPPFATTACITSICSDYYELKEMPGRTDTLSSLLGTPYPPGYAVTCRGTGGRISDPQQQQQQLYSKEEIEAMVPASEAEISAALHQLGAVEIEGKLRVLSKYVLFDAMKALLQSMVALDLFWAEDGLWVSEDEGCRLLSSGGGESTPNSSSSIVDPHVLRGCLDLLGYCTVEADPRTRTWKIDALEVSRMTAHLVLQEGEEEEEEEGEEEEGQQQRRRRRGSTSCTVDVSIAGRDRCSYRCRVMAANDFQFEWSMRTPSKAVTDYGGSQQLLYGLAVLSTLKSSLMQGTSSGSGSSIAVDEPCYFYLPTKRPISSTDDDQLDELPRDPKSLFGLLFAIKDSYSYLELEPYLQLLVRSSGGGAAALNILGAHTRKTSTADNIITYSAKS